MGAVREGQWTWWQLGMWSTCIEVMTGSWDSCQLCGTSYRSCWVCLSLCWLYFGADFLCRYQILAPIPLSTGRVKCLSTDPVPSMWPTGEQVSRQGVKKKVRRKPLEVLGYEFLRTTWKIACNVYCDIHVQDVNSVVLLRTVNSCVSSAKLWQRLAILQSVGEPSSGDWSRDWFNDLRALINLATTKWLR